MKVMMSTKDYTWCESCKSWIDTNSLEHIVLNNISWKCCPACGDGIVMTIDEISTMDKENKINIAKGIWGL